MKFAKHVDGFCRHLTDAGYAERTAQTYQAHLKRFLSFVEQHYPSIRRVEQIGRDVIRDFQSSLIAGAPSAAQQPLSAATRSLILSAVRKFFDHLVKADYILKDPTSSIVLPKKEQRLPRNVLTEQDVVQLLHATKPHGPTGLRNRAIVELLYGCGIRTTELCNLRTVDVDLKQQTVTIVRGKGGKSRVVPIGQYAAHYIEQYVQRGRRYFLRHRHDDPGNLFLSGWGNPFTNTTINRTVMRKLGRKAGLSKDISCYSLRHGVATHLLAADVDITYIAKLLGHSSLKSTQQYLHVEIGDLKRIHSLFHPRELRSDPVD